MHVAPELIATESYEWGGKSYRIELMSRPLSVPTFFAYVSDAAGNVVQTQDTSRPDLARKAAHRQARQDGPSSPKTRANGPAPQRVPEERSAAILAFLEANPWSPTARVADAIGQRFSTARKSLRKMEAAGRLTCEVTRLNTGRRERWAVAGEVRP